MPVQESSQSRRVVVSHNVDKALKEGNESPLHKRFSKMFYDHLMSTLGHCLCARLFGQHYRFQIIIYKLAAGIETSKQSNIMYKCFTRDVQATSASSFTVTAQRLSAIFEAFLVLYRASV